MADERAAAGPAWRAAYRLQLHPGFTFADAEALVDHLAELGISHLYLSPVLEAGPGSTHGYDVTDHTRVRGALGGADGLRRLAEAAHDRDLGIVLDWVPNHMSFGAHGAGNDWWWDVLEHGPGSVHASTFDIDWSRGRLLLPVLDDHLHRVATEGRLQVHDLAGSLSFTVGEQRFPLRPESVTGLLGADGVDGHDSSGGELLDEVLGALNADPQRLLALHHEQHYRLARWQLANHEVGHRRFFDVTDLIGLRVEDPDVFARTHALLTELIDDGTVDGLRLDHPDGLRDPERYLQRLARAAPGTPLWVEKILAPGEVLRPSWPVAGTTGYDFCDLVTRLQLDPEGTEALRVWFVDRAERPPAFDEEERAGKRLALHSLLVADVDRCVALGLDALAELGWDATHAEARAVLIELAVGLEVYRTYIRPGTEPDPTDVGLLAHAVDRAFDALEGRVDPGLTGAIAALLARPGPPPGPAAELAVRFQQLSAPAAAKGAEDTAVYRWAPSVATAEVGSRPDLGSIDPATFHDAIRATAARWPDRLLDTSTHDTKRSEDVRACAAALTEVAADWIAAAEAVLARTAPHPDPPTALIALQTLVAAWPVEPERLDGYLEKAAREAKLSTSWVDQDEAYEAGLRAWGRRVLEDPGARRVVDQVTERVAVPGWRNGVVQLVLKLTCPGVPVIYQGTEVWDGSLVDPDNRRPVDHDRRRALLAAEQAEPGAPLELGPDAKLPVLARVLALRARRPRDLTGTASHEPLAVEGAAADHVVAYRRGEGVVVVAGRLLLRLEREGGWRETEVHLPAAPGGGPWRDVLGGGIHDGPTPAGALVGDLGVAVLEPLDARAGDHGADASDASNAARSGQATAARS